MDTDQVILINKIKELRARDGLTQEDLAERVGVTRQTIISIEKGHYVPSLALGMLIAHALNVSTDELFTIDRKEQ
jgi:putative transcriptional regulator